MKILLFGGGLQVLTIAQSLKSCDYRVFVAGKNNEVSKHCRYVDKCFDVDIDNLDVLDFINVIKSGDYKVVIPMEDEYATWLSKNKEIIESNTVTKCAVMEYSVFSLAADKTTLLAFCKEKGLPHPRTALIDNNYDEIAEYVGFPALIKPSHSAGARGIRMVNNMAELLEIAKRTINEYGSSSLQEFIGGKDYYYNVMLYRTSSGEWANHVITKIIRYYPINGGSSSFCYTIENEKLLSICQAILDELNWTGFADFDVLEKGDGDYRVIEINPRVPASVKAAAISGVNFGEIIVKDALGLDIPTYKYKTNMQLRYLGLDIAWFLSSPNRFKCTPSWFKFFGRNLYYQEGGFNDIFAMIASLFSGVKKIISPSFRKSKSGMN